MAYGKHHLTYETSAVVVSPDFALRQISQISTGGITLAKERRASRRLTLTDVTVDPDSNYSFAIWAGRQQVAKFTFHTLSDAFDAAQALALLLPRVEVARRRKLRWISAIGNRPDRSNE